MRSQGRRSPLEPGLAPDRRGPEHAVRLITQPAPARRHGPSTTPTDFDQLTHMHHLLLPDIHTTMDIGHYFPTKAFANPSPNWIANACSMCHHSYTRSNRRGGGHGQAFRLFQVRIAKAATLPRLRSVRRGLVGAIDLDPPDLGIQWQFRPPRRRAFVRQGRRFGARRGRIAASRMARREGDLPEPTIHVAITEGHVNPDTPSTTGSARAFARGARVGSTDSFVAHALDVHQRTLFSGP